MSLLLALLLALLILSLPTWPYSAAWGFYPSGGLGIVLLVVFIIAIRWRNAPADRCFSNGTGSSTG